MYESVVEQGFQTSFNAGGLEDLDTNGNGVIDEDELWDWSY